MRSALFWDITQRVVVDGRECSTYVESTVVCSVLVGKPEGKRPLGRIRIDGSIILSWIVRKRDVGL